jgi:hypothetical protein
MTQPQGEFLSQLQKIDAHEFERFIADLWELQNWDTLVTTGTDDGGIDIIAEQSTPFPKKQVIQVKRYEPSNSVGRPDIQQYASIRQERTDVDTVVVVTTGRFTDEAEDIATDLNVKLIDGEKLGKLIASLGAVQIARSYIDSEVTRDEVSQQDSETHNSVSQPKGDSEGSAQSIPNTKQGTQADEVPRFLSGLISLHQKLTSDLESIQSTAKSAEQAFQHGRYFDAVEGYETVNRQRTGLERNITRYDVGLTQADPVAIQHLPDPESFATRLNDATEDMDEHFQEAFQITERANGLNLLVAEISEGVDSVIDSIARGDQLRKNAEVDRAHGKYKQAKSTLDGLRQPLEIYRGLISAYDDDVIESHTELPKDVSIAELEEEVTTRIESKGESEVSNRRDIAQNATGFVEESVLADNSGELFDKDLVEYLADDERLEFLFEPPRMGFKIAAAGEQRGEPQHEALQSGASFLIVTDQRILYVAGVNDHDETESIPYEQLSDIGISIEGSSRDLQLVSTDATKYMFEGLRDNQSDLERAASFIREHLEELS